MVGRAYLHIVNFEIIIINIIKNYSQTNQTTVQSESVHTDCHFKTCRWHLDQGWLKGGIPKTPLETKILETPPLEKFWNTPPPKIRREAPALNWLWTGSEFNHN